MMHCEFRCLIIPIAAISLKRSLQSATNSSLLRPITLTIFQATDVVVENINYVNSPEWHNLVTLIPIVILFVFSPEYLPLRLTKARM